MNKEPGLIQKRTGLPQFYWNGRSGQKRAISGSDAERKRIRENGAEELTNSNVEEEVRDEPEEIKEEETPVESSAAQESPDVEAEAETIEVVPSSPKKSLTTVVLGDSISTTEEEQRTEVEVQNTSNDEVIDRVTAE